MSDQQQPAEGRNYDLRSRSDINAPSRYGSRDATSPHTLRRKRGGKKGAITKRITQINEIIASRGSRTKLRMLTGQLQLTLKDAAAYHEQLMKHIDKKDEEFSDDYIEDLSMKVDTCVSQVTEYLESRADDLPSDTMSEILPEQTYVESETDLIYASSHDERTMDWCERQRIFDSSAKSAPVEELSAQLQSLSIREYGHGYENRHISSVADQEKATASQTMDFRPPLITTDPLTNDANPSNFMPSTTGFMHTSKSIPYNILSAGIGSHHPEGIGVNSEYNVYGSHSFGGARPKTLHNCEYSQTQQAITNQEVLSCKDNVRFDPILSNSLGENSFLKDKYVPSPYAGQYKTDGHYPCSYTVGQESIASRISSSSNICPSFQTRGRNTYTETLPTYALPGTHMSMSSFIPVNYHQQRMPFTSSRDLDAGFPCVTASFSKPISSERFMQQPLGSYHPTVDKQCHEVRQAHNHNLNNQTGRTEQHRPGTRNDTSVDKWVDDLPEYEHDYIQQIEGNVATTHAMQRWMVNQNLPKMEIPKFDGSAIHWVDFITQFKDIVHFQPYLTTARRMAYLQQHLEKEAKRSVSGFKGDWSGYKGALRRLKFIFGQRAGVAHAHLSKVTKGKSIKDGDMAALTEFYYDISDCLSNLQRLEYYSDLGSSDVLRQAVARLPTRLKNKWGERSYSIRRTKEPNLYHLEEWLGERIMAARDPFMPQDSGISSNESRCNNNTLRSCSTELKDDPASRTNSKVCVLCKGEDHIVFKCKSYTEKNAEGRFKFVKDNKLCFNCLRPYHSTKQCKSKFNCFISGCGRSHHTSLHDHFKRALKKPDSSVASNGVNLEEHASVNEGKKEGEKEVTDASNLDMVNVSHTSRVIRKNVFFKTVPIKIVSEEGLVAETFAFLDDGSEGTFLCEDLANLLKVKGRETKVTIGTIVDGKGKEIRTRKTSITISGMHKNAKEFTIQEALVLPKEKFHAKAQYLPSDFKTNTNYGHLQEFNFTDIHKDKIQLLIGTDNYETSLVLEMKKGKDIAHPIAARTPLGWTLFGRVEEGLTNDNDEISTVINSIRSDTLNEELNENVKRFWTTEAFGTEFVGIKPYSVQDVVVEKGWDASTTFHDGHYTVSMPWKDRSEKLPNNRQMARKRFESLLNRFKRNPELHSLYKANIQEYIKCGYARKLSPEEVSKQSSKTWYLPHHPVMNVNKPNKVRTVFDAAATFNHTCLNDHLHTGPDLVNNLIGVLLRFRKHAVAIIADIEAMFHQVRVTEEDRDSLRFLWKDDLDDTLPPEDFQMMVHIFGAKSSPSCSGYALKKAACDSSEEFPIESVNTITRDFYVDDLLKSCASPEVAIRTAHDVMKILGRRGFNLTKFTSNSPEVLAALPEKKLAHQKEFFELEGEPLERTLGVRWNVKKDTMTFTTEYKEQSYTKRGILKTLSVVFDPLGFLAPYTVRAKILLQGLWRKGYDWDADIEEADKIVWKKWLSEIPFLPEFEIPRCYLLRTNNSRMKTTQLHVFADASELAFGAVCYIRTVDSDDNVSCCMLFSKSRLAPIKTLTVPRLELQAAVLATRVKNVVVTEIDEEINTVHFWTDSTITLQYISNETKRFKTFVANRVAEIREHSKPSQWNHIKGEDNPADLMTRGLTPVQIGINSKWVLGPEFLNLNEERWPVQTAVGELLDETEVRTVAHLCERTTTKFENCSSWTKLLNIVSWMLRFIDKCKNKESPSTDHVTMKEVRDARVAVFKCIQLEHFHDELHLLCKGERLPPDSVLTPLGAYLDGSDGLIRVGGRIRKAPIPFISRHQVILPSKNYLVTRLVCYEHKLNFDCGPNQLLGVLQERYWIIGAKRLINNIQRNCLECKKRTSKPQVPLMADLPKFRLELQSPVFYNTGVDFFGPINTKLGRRVQKRWGAIFTCLVTRAIHLEVAESLSTDAFINTLERFVNRRGNPSKIVSDCGSNFKGADKELRTCLKELQQSKLEAFSARKSIEWIFNPPEAPHMGGVWERLVRSVKIPLRIILKDRTLTDFQLCTVFTEVESLVNSRPLTPVSSDPNDLEALTPNHFLLGRSSPNLPFNMVYDTDRCSRKRWKEVQFVTTQIWKRWKREYLPTLSIRPKWHIESRNMRIGDLVMVVDDNLPRGMWKLGRVINIFPGDDLRVRVVKVKTQSGNYIRPVTKLCLLEEDQMAKDIVE